MPAPSAIARRLIVALLCLATAGLAAAPAATAAFGFKSQFGSVGSGPGQFHTPLGVALAPSGNVYVADGGNDRVQELTAAGAFVRAWGSSGNLGGEFNLPEDVAVGPGAHQVYVTDCHNNRVQRFLPGGELLGLWGSVGAGLGQFACPEGIATDSGGRVYVADTQNNRVQKFTAAGAILAEWSAPEAFDFPRGITVDQSGVAYVTEAGVARVQTFSSSTGVYLGRIGDQRTLSPPVNGVAVDRSGSVWVSDFDGLAKFTPGGSPLLRFIGRGSGPGQFRFPAGIDTDANCNVYVADRDNARIQVLGEQQAPFCRAGGPGLGVTVPKAHLGPSVAVKAKCPWEACTADASATLNVPRTARTYRLRARSLHLAADGQGTLRLKLGRSARRAAGRALRHGRRLKLKVRATAKSAQGVQTVERRTARLVG